MRQHKTFETSTDDHCPQQYINLMLNLVSVIKRATDLPHSRTRIRSVALPQHAMSNSAVLPYLESFCESVVFV